MRYSCVICITYQGPLAIVPNYQYQRKLPAWHSTGPNYTSNQTRLPTRLVTACNWVQRSEYIGRNSIAVEITTLEQPIDAMYLIHKALRGEAGRTVELAKHLETGCSLQAFKLAFTAWATAIMYHAEKEVGIAR